MTTLSNAVRDRKTNVNDKLGVWQANVDAAISEMTEEFRPLGGIPQDVKVAKDELMKVFATCKRTVGQVNKVFEEMDFEELTNEQQRGALDMKTKLTDACAPIVAEGKNITAAPHCLLTFWFALFVCKHFVLHFVFESKQYGPRVLQEGRQESARQLVQEQEQRQRPRGRRPALCEADRAMGTEQGFGQDWNA